MTLPLFQQGDTATFSPCGRYRYLLQREFWRAGRAVAFIMLNPSTADAKENDPTIRRCIGFAGSLGGCRLLVGNLFGWRATKPAALREAKDPIGPDNDAMLREILRQADVVVCAWGANGAYLDRDRAVLDLISAAGKEPQALHVTSEGFPGHPLYLPWSAKPKPYGGRP